MTLNESIRQLRRKRSMTQEQLAEAMNVSAAAVSKWENGQSVPDIAVLTALADYFEISLDALVGYTVQSHRREDSSMPRPWRKRTRPCAATPTISAWCTPLRGCGAATAWSTATMRRCSGRWS